MKLFQSKTDLLSANSRFAGQNDGMYLPRIARETCTYGYKYNFNVFTIEFLQFNQLISSKLMQLFFLVGGSITFSHISFSEKREQHNLPSAFLSLQFHWNLWPLFRLPFLKFQLPTFLCVQVSFVKVHRILQVAHYFVFGNQNKQFVYWRGWTRQKTVNKQKQIYFIPQTVQLIFGGLNINKKQCSTFTSMYLEFCELKCIHALNYTILIFNFNIFKIKPLSMSLLWDLRTIFEQNIINTYRMNNYRKPQPTTFIESKLICDLLSNLQFDISKRIFNSVNLLFKNNTNNNY